MNTKFSKVAVSSSAPSIQELIKKYSIPSRPGLVSELIDKIKADDLSLDELVSIVSHDFQLATTIIQSANAILASFDHKPDPVTSVRTALALLRHDGLNRVLLTLKAKEQLTVEQSFTFYRFWDSSVDVAMLSRYIALKLLFVDQHHAFMTGLLHDSGIAILNQAIPEYHRFVLEHGSDQSQAFVQDEMEQFGIAHPVVSYRIAEEIGMPEVVCRAILSHHDVSVVNDDCPELLDRDRLVSVVYLAEMISDRFRSLHHGDHVVNHWYEIPALVLQCLELTQCDAEDLMDAMLEGIDDILHDHFR